MSTRDGGKPIVKPLPYSPPQGPLAGGNHVEPKHGQGGESLSDGYREFTGSPGIGGTNHGNCGSQRKG